MINFVVKPSSYTGASDTNGGGFSNTYDAVYATFCNSDGSALYDSTFTALSGSGGSYALDITTTANCVTGVICRIDITEGSAGYFYGEITAITDGDTLAIAYVAVGDTSALAQAAVDAAISGGNDTGNIAVGGVLATPNTAVLLCSGVTQNALFQSGTYAITAAIDVKVAYEKIIVGVKSDGTEPEIWSDDMPIITAGATLDRLIDGQQGANWETSISNIIFDGNNAGTRATCCIQGQTNASYTWTLNLHNVICRNATQQGIEYAGYLAGYRFAVACLNNTRNGLANTENSRPAGTFYNSMFCGNGYSGIYVSVVNLKNCILCNNSEYGFEGYSSSSNYTLENCLLINNTLDAFSIPTTKTTRTITAINSIIYGDSQTINSAAVVALFNCYNTMTFSQAVTYDKEPITTAPVFVDAGNDDYRLTTTGNADYFDDTTGILLCGPLGKAPAAGTGGTGILRLAGTGGLVG